MLGYMKLLKALALMVLVALAPVAMAQMNHAELLTHPDAQKCFGKDSDAAGIPEIKGTAPATAPEKVRALPGVYQGVIYLHTSEPNYRFVCVRFGIGSVLEGRRADYGAPVFYGHGAFSGHPDYAPDVMEIDPMDVWIDSSGSMEMTIGFVRFRDMVADETGIKGFASGTKGQYPLVLKRTI